MLKTLVKRSFAKAWHKLEDDERINKRIALVEVERSSRPEFGDFSSGIALAEAKNTTLSAHELATEFANALSTDITAELYSQVEIAGPGFVNVFLAPSLIHSALREILEMGDRFGYSTTGQEKPVQVEFVSSNPTGPLTVGHGRQAVLGDVLASLYTTLGYKVSREYYFNDEGHQIDLLAQSLWARYRQEFGDKTSIPEQGYQGEYIVDIARQLAKEPGPSVADFDEQTANRFKQEAISRISLMIKNDLDLLGVKFDSWFSEQTLHHSGEVTAALEALKACGGVYEREGAIWLKTEENHGVKDSVLVRSDGRPTYLMVDIAYHINKHRRGFVHVINVQGADHQVEQSCMRAAMRILGYPEDFLDYAVHQFVSIREHEKITRMSTRAGKFILLNDLLDELGRNVVRYFMVARKPTSHLEFDIDLARTQSLDNPLYYIQYAHTRIASIFRRVGSPALSPQVDLRPLEKREELDLIKQLDRFPEMLQQAAFEFSPHLVADYALTLARAFHAYYDSYRVLGDQERLTTARLALLRGVQIVLHRSLQLLGLSIPEEM